jgi:hypothetical protein
LAIIEGKCSFPRGQLQLCGRFVARRCAIFGKLYRFKVLEPCNGCRLESVPTSIPPTRPRCRCLGVRRSPMPVIASTHANGAADRAAVLTRHSPPHAGVHSWCGWHGRNRHPDALSSVSGRNGTGVAGLPDRAQRHPGDAIRHDPHATTCQRSQGWSKSGSRV